MMNLFSVRGFETETSNFAPNDCLWVSINRKFDARSNGMLRMIPRPLLIGCFYKKFVFGPVFEENPSHFHTFMTFYRSFFCQNKDFPATFHQQSQQVKRVLNPPSQNQIAFQSCCQVLESGGASSNGMGIMCPLWLVWG